MKDGQEFEINGMVYIINEYELEGGFSGGWYWYCPEHNEESICHPTGLEALQDALDATQTEYNKPPEWSVAAAELEDARKEY
jgi:hypothetical protein